MRKGTCQRDKLKALRRIEGQVRGVQKMIEDERYCIDILNTIAAVIGALKRVESNILKSHIDSCVKMAFNKTSKREREAKLTEVYSLLEGARR